MLWKTHGTERRSLAAAGGGGRARRGHASGILLWRFAGPTPLSTAIHYSWPGLTAIVTPIIDPDLGLCWWFPGLLVTLGIGASAGRSRCASRRPFTAVSIGFLLMCARRGYGNVNPRRDSWGEPLRDLAGAVRHRRVSKGWEQWPATLAAHRRSSGLGGADGLDKPSQDSPRTRWPRHPPPSGSRITCRDSTIQCLKCFSERYTGVDGAVPLPVSSHECGKVLLSGLRRASVRWPIPCMPAPIPEACRAPGVLCYANRVNAGYVFDIAPQQPGFWLRCRGRAGAALEWTSRLRLAPCENRLVGDVLRPAARENLADPR